MRRTSHIAILLLLAILTATVGIVAMPAQPGKRLVRLPNGTLREVVQRGDEHCHWLETPDGQRLTEPVSSVPRTAALHPRFRTRRQANSSLLIDGCFPPIGKHKLLAVLVNYADTKPTVSSEDFNAMMNQENFRGIGSFRDYYLQQSYGQLDITTTVTRWVTLSKNKSMYAGDYVTNLIHETLQQLDGEIDFRDFDNDGDGVLDGLIIIHQGLGQEATADANDIWSHSSTVYGMQFDGITIYRYTIEPELYRDRQTSTMRQTGIGVVCHEFGHNLGASDYYDSDYESRGSYCGTGYWDLMGSGAWNGPVWMSSACGDAPAPITAWQKIQFGWMQPTILEGTQYISAMPALGTTPMCYQLNTSITGDYYILENRQNVTPWDRYTPGHGLLAMHAIESVIREELPTNTINAKWPQGFYTVCANAKTDPITEMAGSYGDINTDAATFPGTAHITSFSDDTKPSCKSSDGRMSYVALENIAENADGLISFDYIQKVAPQKPLNFTAKVARGVVTLTWTLPEGTEPPTHFSIYRDGALLTTTSDFSYTDTEANTMGTITYHIDATYANGLTSAYAEATTRIPVNKASNLSLEDTGQALILRWEQPMDISRCVDNMKYNLTEHITPNFRYAHRFRPEDLLPYIGCKVRGITFIPNQASYYASYKICVWRALPGEKEGTLISSRDVKEFSPTYRRTILFTSQATIEEGYEYWIGVEIASNNNATEVITDQSELINGYGNWMSMGGTAWQADPSAVGNFFLIASLTAPASPVLVENIPNYTDIDATIDLYYPLAYNVYADGVLKGTTTGTSYELTRPANIEEYHSYSIVSLYKGNNESKPLTLTTGDSGIAPITIDKSQNAALYDLMGRSRSQSTLPRGIYIHNGKKIIR